MAAGLPEPPDHLTKDLTGPRLFLRGPHRQDQLILVDPAAHGPIHLLEADHEIDHLRGLLRLRKVVHPTNDEAIVNERALKRLKQALEVAVRQPCVANLGDRVLIRERVEVEQCVVVGLAGFARVARHFGLDAVQKCRSHLLGNRDILFAQILGHDGTRRPVARADIREGNAFQIARRVVVIDHRIKFHRVREGVPARVRLAVHHHDRIALGPFHVLDLHEVQVEHVHHGAILGPAYQAVAGDERRLPQTLFDEVGQPEHAAQAVRIGLNVRHEHDPVAVQ